ncbi:hypothetical protein JCM1841_000844 [Sporobolomyces salmonicolor]
MGLFTKKKRDPPATGLGVSASRTTSAPASTTLALPSESSAPSPTESSFSSTFSRPHKTSTSSSRFGNPFRSASSPGSSNSPLHLHGDSPSPNGGIRSAGALSPAAGYARARGERGGGEFAGSITSSSRKDVSTRQSGWDEPGAPTPNLPRGRDSPALEPLDRYRLFGGKASSSTISLPLFVRDDSEPRERQMSAVTAATAEERSHRDDEQAVSGGSKWSRWKLGRGLKQRSGSISSVRALSGEGLGISGGTDEGGFVVKSFRTVSRVHEDPISSGPYQSSPPAISPPLPLPAPVLDHHGDSHQQESLRTSVDFSTSGHPHRPPRNSRSPASAASPPLLASPSASGGWRDVADRAPSPSTISVEAFRLASARSRSSVSLHSLASVGDPTSPTSGNEPRPRFEPVQRPSSRTSRRGSSYSDIGIASGSFLPPRPAFAHDRNASSSSVHSRASSVASIGSFMLGNAGQPQQGQGQQADAGRAGVGLTNSESFASVASFTTAPTAMSSRITSPAKPSPSTSTSPPPAADQLYPKRPANPKRASSGDSDLRWIASYAESNTSSSPATSPVVPKSIALPPSSPPAFETPKKTTPLSNISGTPASTASLTPTTSRLAADSGTPSFAVQPPTPVAIPGLSAFSKTSQLPQRPPKRSSSLIPSSTQSALQAAGVGPPRRMSVGALPTATSSSAGKGKAKAQPASRGWTSDTSDEDEEEALTTDSDEANSDSDDEVPLATIKSRSQTDLTLPALQAQSGGKEVEQGSPYSRLGAGAKAYKAGTPLGRRGSNRRSVSTLSFSTAALAIPSPGAASSSSATPGVPPSQTRSILRPPYQARSTSNPNSPVPPFLSPISSPSLSPAPASHTSASGVSAYTLPAVVAANSSSSSSGSGSGSTSSALLTPNDLSPAVSDFGVKGFPSNFSAGTKPSVKFDLASLATNGAETTRWNQGRRMSALPTGSSASSAVGGGPGGLYPPSLQGHRSTPSLPTFAANSARSAVGAKSSQSLLHPGSTIRASPSAASLAPSSKTASASNAGSGEGTVYDRMKARYKAEALQAMQIGSDLNNPSGLVPDEEDDDENEPLASLPTRLGGGGSMIGGEGSMSTMGGMPGMMGGMPMGMGMGFGGAYSPLAVAPPGVDPYLYASLPPDQKMSLHQRSQQMMAMMAQAALHARAESVMAGSAIGGYGGGGDSMLNGGGSMRGGATAGHMRGTMSMGNLDALGGYGAPGGRFDPFGMLGGHPSQQQHPQFNSHSHLPPFAPSFAMSQAFMQHGMTAQAPSPSLYAMPAYAGSAIGFPTGGMGIGPASMMGVPSSGGGRKDRGVRAASTIGLGQRR